MSPWKTCRPLILTPKGMQCDFCGSTLAVLELADNFYSFQSLTVNTHSDLITSVEGHLLVAPMMKTFFLLLMPSISVSSWLMTRSAAPPPSPTLPPRDFAIESSSSKNRTHGAAARDCNIHTASNIYYFQICQVIDFFNHVICAINLFNPPRVNFGFNA